MSIDNVCMGNICRVCLEKSNKLYPLQGRVPNVNEDISSMIKYCTFLEVTIEDDLPRGVCIPCFKTIRIAYNFVCQFKESNEKLLEIKKNAIKTEFIIAQDYRAQKNVLKDELLQECENIEEIIIEYHKEDVICSNTNNSKLVSKEECGEFEIDCNEVEVSSISLTEEQSEEINGDISGNELEDELPEESHLQKRDISSFACPICSQRFSKFEAGFVKHLSTHEHVKLSCDKCSLATILSVDLYVQHYRKAHRFQCNVCSKNYGRRSGLYYHIKTHDNAKVYKCSYPSCTKSFLTRWCLTKHFHTHSESSKYVCSKCGSEFKTYGTYKYHQKTHDGNRSHLCTECGQTFLQSIHLKYHMWKHTGIKMFQCDTCHKSYTSQTQLKKHAKKKNCAGAHKTAKKHFKCEET